MKAIQIQSYGAAETMQLVDIEAPLCGAQEVLVKVIAAGVNPVDWKIRSGMMAGAITRAMPLTLGWDAAGVVVTAGSAVNNFVPGDEVFFYADFAHGGTYAEQVVVDASQVAHKPRNMSFSHAAALPMAGQAAWAALVDTAQLQSGQRVLIHGAAGALGSIAVQLAKQMGAEVIATASGAGLELVHNLGASNVIAYRSQRFEEVVKEVDVVIDTVGGATQDASWSTLRRGGILVATAMPPVAERAAAVGARAAFLFTPPRGKVLAQLAKRVEAGLLQCFVAQELGLEDAAYAHQCGEAGKARGKMVLQVGTPPRP